MPQCGEKARAFGIFLDSFAANIDLVRLDRIDAFQLLKQMVDRLTGLVRPWCNVLTLAPVLDDQDHVVNRLPLFRDEGGVREDKEKQAKAQSTKSGPSGPPVGGERH